MSRFKYHVFVCENRRDPDDPKGCCASKGSQEFVPILREKVKSAGLAGQVRINSSGCLSNCARGPAIVVYPEGIWYSQVKITDLDDIFERHLVDGEPVRRLLDLKFHAEKSEGSSES
ncbi:MAG: (2Fe-2S) ferredoxin domain-containing protein [Calditrichaeota bacterium]|nr:(2Fe-2S) ferredoxin domain-containing protein [Calditrichota bacterium]MCB9368090.1 (2Fe-2S) ferredoxin domain-containing protein [Calditrichota bacterium]